jgi:hypothetical protein
MVIMVPLLVFEMHSTGVDDKATPCAQLAPAINSALACRGGRRARIVEGFIP